MKKQIKILILIISSALILSAIFSFFFLIESSQINQKMNENKKTDESKEEIPSEFIDLMDDAKEELMPEIKESEELADSEEEKDNLETQELLKLLELEIKEFKTDKKTYGSYEEIQFTVKIISNQNVKNAEVKITGIKPYSYPYINQSNTVNLSLGENNFTFKAKTPNCTSGCGGVYPGPYDVYLDIFINGSLIKNEKTIINLVSH